MTYQEKVEKGYIQIKDKWRVKQKYDSLPPDVKPIPDYPTYYATPNGEIWRHSPGKGIRKSRIIKLKDRYNSVNGYHQIQPYQNDKRKLTYTHRLVLAAYKGWPPEGYECNHIDRNTSNNQISNLEWIPKEENIALVIRNPSKGKKGPNKNKTISKWSSIKPKILKLRQEGKKAKEIAFELDIPIEVVYVYRR